MEEYIQYLRPETIAQITSMELRARFVVEGFITGLHRSPYHGFSVEFSEHRQYLPGDELKRIDWKVYAKTDRFFVKQYEEETNVKTYIVLDASRSMAYASEGRITKFQYATYLAAALAYLMMEQRDAVGLTLFDDRLRLSLPPRGTKVYLKQILIELERAIPSSSTETAKALHTLAEQIRRRGLVVVLSDLFDEPTSIIRALKHFRYKGNEVIVLQVIDPLERSFAFGADAVFRDMETQEELMTQPWHIQHAYQHALKEHIDQIQQACRDVSIDYVLLETTVPFNVALLEYLHKRIRMQ
ncbi:MAG: DUF58 domain-containing protein [Bacteroidetes bacterium]|nr:DUF58 domain-containing protein [Bacteroidota bacterium]